jgi:hypothetical protein
VKRIRETVFLDRPWAVPPDRDSLVSLSTAFYQNLIVGNHASDGMTGIQLWIAGIENVISGNTIARQRKPGLLLYANATTLASSMPRTWNRGISPLFWTSVEGNRVDECSAGVRVTIGDAPELPIEFPRALGNVIRHNSFVRSRTDGVSLSSRPPSDQVLDTSASIVGTVVEFNVVRDAQTAYHAGPSTDATLFHRNHAYFWYPVSLDPSPPVAFQIDQANTIVIRDANRVEGPQGETDNRITEVRAPEGDPEP